MNRIKLFLLVALVPAGCTNIKQITYLSNLSDGIETQYFPVEIPDYTIQYRDLLYINIKTVSTEGTIEDLLQGRSNVNSSSYMQNESTQYLLGYTVDKEGFIMLPSIGRIKVSAKTIPDTRKLIQRIVDSVYNNSYVDVKLLSFKYTVLGEVRSPGSYFNYNEYLTIFEAIGHAGGVGDYGRRDKVIILRTESNGTKTYSMNLQDKKILTSAAYFIMPNDVIIVGPERHKIFNLNLPTITFTISSVTSIITTTLLLVNYFGNQK